MSAYTILCFESEYHASEELSDLSYIDLHWSLCSLEEMIEEMKIAMKEADLLHKYFIIIDDEMNVVYSTTIE